MEELIIKYLFEGKTQPEISELLKREGVKPNSLSSIEKSLKKIKAQYKANTMFHLAAILCRTTRLGDNLEKLLRHNQKELVRLTKKKVGSRKNPLSDNIDDITL